MDIIRGAIACAVIILMMGIAGAMDAADQKMYENRVSYDERN